MMKHIIPFAVLVLITMTIASTVSSQPESSQIRATVIISFGNGEELSATVTLPPNNATAIKATELACENLSLYLNYSWSTYGAFVTQIGWEKNDYMGSGYYWHLMVWKNDSYEWTSSIEGASSLQLKDGDIVAWIYTVDNPSWKPYNLPKSAPANYVVWATPRGNFNNTGVSQGEIYRSDLIWKFKGDSPWGFSSTPVVGNGMLYIADSSALYALNFNGSLIWKNSKGAAGGYGIASPILFGDFVIIGTYDQYLRAFNALNGTLAWEAYIGEDITSSPVVDIVNRTPMVFVATFKFGAQGHLYAFYLENGTQKWNLTLLGSNYFGIPLIFHGKLYVPIAGIEDSSYRWNPPFGVQCIDEHGFYIWNYTTEDSIRSSIVASGKRIYFLTANGNLTAMNENGSVIWIEKIESSTSSPAVYNDMIYVGGKEGNIYAIKDEGNSASIIWKKKVNGAVQSNVLYASGNIIATTNIQNGTVYVFSSQGELIWNYTPQPKSYLFSSPVIGDSFLLIASNSGYLYALGDALSLPQIKDVEISNAFVNSIIEISFSSEEEYQAILFYRNDTEDKYHAIWMSYENGRYVGYIPPQKEGNVYFYISLVSSTGEMRTSSIHEFSVINPIPEITFVLPIILAVLISIMLRDRVRG